MGVLASAGGIGGGIAIAKGIDALFGVMGVDLSDWPLIVATRTLIAAAVDRHRRHAAGRDRAGPPRRLGAAHRGAAAAAPTQVRSRRRRRIDGRIGAGHRCRPAGRRRRRRLVGSIGAGGLALGVMAIFLGVTVLSPLLVRGVTRRVRLADAAGSAASPAGSPSRTPPGTRAAPRPRPGIDDRARAGDDGARRRCSRSRRRSARRSSDAAKADYYVTDELDEVEFPATLADDLRRSDVVDRRHRVHARSTPGRRRVTGVVGFDFDQIDALLDVDVQAGGFDGTVSRIRWSCRPTRPQAIGAGVGDVGHPRGRQRIARRGDDRRAVRRPGDPGRGLPRRHRRPRRRRGRSDRRSGSPSRSPTGIAAGDGRGARRRPVGAVPERLRRDPERVPSSGSRA